MRALLLPVGADRYALELTQVREVVRAPALTPLPGAPPSVAGVMNLRGEVVLVLDTAALLGTGRLSDVAFAAVTEIADEPVALAADAEPATVALDRPAGAARHPAGAGRFAAAGGVVTLLDLGVLLEPARIGGG